MGAHASLYMFILELFTRMYLEISSSLLPSLPGLLLTGVWHETELSPGRPWRPYVLLNDSMPQHIIIIIIIITIIIIYH